MIDAADGTGGLQEIISAFYDVVRQYQVRTEEGEESDARNWLIGDMAVQITRLAARARRQNPSIDLEDMFLNQTKIAKSTFNSRRWVARRYSPSERERFPNLRWVHFRLAAERPNRLDLLEQANKEQWTSRQLALVLKGGDPKEEAQRLQHCAQCGRQIDKRDALLVEGSAVGLQRFDSLDCVIQYLIQSREKSR